MIRNYGAFLGYTDAPNKHGDMERVAVLLRYEEFMFKNNHYGPAMSGYDIRPEDYLPELDMRTAEHYKILLSALDYREEDVAIIQEALDNPDKEYLPVQGPPAPEFIPA